MTGGALAVGAGGWAVSQRTGGGKPIRVGVLHSLTGTMAFSERSVVDAALLAIEELNEAGGLLGRQVTAIVADGRSDAAVFATEAERLISAEGVAAIFGCWTSASRRTVRPVIERLGGLLFYPVQYEGLEESRSVIYLGAAPNQQIIPAVKWSLDHVGRRFFLAGSDYVFPRAANAIIRDQVAALQGQVVGEEYVLLGSNDVGAMIARIKETRPDLVLNTINGDTNLAFFRALRAAGFSADDLPVISFSIGENELRTLPAAEIAGHYAAWNYFQSVSSEQNRAFVSRFKRRYGSGRVTSDPMEAAYVGVHLWAQAVQEAGTEEARAVRDGIRRQSRNAPEGPVYIDPDNGHTWRVVRIGRVREDGLFDVVWSSGTPIRPAPFPIHRTKAAWLTFLDEMQRGWGGAWANPGPR